MLNFIYIDCQLFGKGFFYCIVIYFQVKFVNRTEQNRIITRLILLQKKILQSLFQSFNRTIISYTKQNIIFNYFKFFYAIF